MLFTPKKTVLSVLVMASTALPSLADNAPPKHGCAKPEHPGKLASDVRMKGFQKEVNDYRDCINKFALDQKTMSEAHMAAGNKAIDDFNAFVKTEMNPKKEE